MSERCPASGAVLYPPVPALRMLRSGMKMQISQAEASVHSAALPLASCRIAGKAVHSAFAENRTLKCFLCLSQLLRLLVSESCLNTAEPKSSLGAVCTPGTEEKSQE